MSEEKSLAVRKASENLMQIFGASGEPDYEILSKGIRKGLRDNRHFMTWRSCTNRLGVIMRGYSDACGTKQWREKGRLLKRGQDKLPVWILCPTIISVKDEDGEPVTQKLTGFRAAKVYGLEQTEGEPVDLVKSDALVIKDIEAALTDAMRCMDVKVQMKATKTLNHNALGWYDRKNKEILVADDSTSVLAHECIHAIDDSLVGHGDEPPGSEEKTRREIVAEFGATLLLHTLGVPAEEIGLKQSLNYMEHYSEKVGEDSVIFSIIPMLSRTMQAVQKLVDKIEEAGHIGTYCTVSGDH